MFEIVDKRDPHIISEKEGEYLLACKSVVTGDMLTPIELSHLVTNLSKVDKALQEIIFPQVIADISFKELKELNAKAKFEGFVVYDLNYKEIVFKLKSPYYLITKFLGRKKDLDKMLKELSKKRLNSEFISKYSIDEEYFPLIEHLNANIDEVLKLDEQCRIKYIREFLENSQD